MEAEPVVEKIDPMVTQSTGVDDRRLVTDYRIDRANTAPDGRYLGSLSATKHRVLDTA